MKIRMYLPIFKYTDSSLLKRTLNDFMLLFRDVLISGINNKQQLINLMNRLRASLFIIQLIRKSKDSLEIEGWEAVNRNKIE